MSETAEKKPAAPALRNYTPITKVKSLQELFEHPGLKARMEEIVPKHLDAGRLLRTFINATLKTPNLAKASPLSMLGCAMTVGYLGLEPNTPLGLMYLIPFDVNKKVGNNWVYDRTDITPIIGYEGYLDLITRGGFIRDIDCQLIWPGDSWENERGSNRHFLHVEKYQPRTETAEPDFAYMFARTTSGGEYLEIMSRTDVHKIRNLSQGYRTALIARDRAAENGRHPSRSYTEAPWIKHAASMWRKTPLRAGQKWLPGRTPELAMAAQLDEASDSGRVRFDNVIDVEAVADGAWEVPNSDYEDEQGPERPPLNPPTQVQVKTPPVDQSTSQQNPKPPAERQQRKAPAKAATARSDEPPADFDERGRPAESTPVPPAAAENPGASSVDPADAKPPEDVRRNEPATSGAQAFETFVLDQNGDPVTEDPETDAMTFAVRLAEMARSWPALRGALLEQNADGIEDAKATGHIGVINILSSLTIADEPSPDEGSAEDETPGVICITLGMDRGKPLVQQYLKDFKAEVEALVDANFLDFIEMNRAEMAKVPQSTLSLCLKALVKRSGEVGVAVPGDLGPSLLQRAPAANATPTLSPADRAFLDKRIAQIAGLGTLDELGMLAEAKLIVDFLARCPADAAAELSGAFGARRQVLGG